MTLNKKEFKMKKGSGYHLDQVLLGIITFIGGLFGLPWMCAATVRTLCHVSSLSVYSRYHAPGEKPKLVKVREQRVTNIAVNLLLGKIFGKRSVRSIFVLNMYQIWNLNMERNLKICLPSSLSEEQLMNFNWPFAAYACLIF